MRRELLLFRGAFVLLAVSLAPYTTWAGQTTNATQSAKPSSASTSWKPLLTSWGDPDLQGVWSNTTTTPLERPDDLKDKAILTDEEHAKRDAEIAARRDLDQAPRRAGDTGVYNSVWLEHGRLNKRTSLIIDPPDGKLPAYTPAGKARWEAFLEDRRLHTADSHETFNAYERCISRGMPGTMMPGFYNHNYKIFQTPTHVVILVEMIHDARIIPINSRDRLSDKLELWLGDSRGHWEGNTLVVETTNVNDKVFEPRITVFGVGRGLRLIERFTRTAEDTIDYQFTVHNPSVYTRPWTAALPMTRIPGQIYEYACHEGNYALPNILSGARVQEKLTAGSAAK